MTTCFLRTFTQLLKRSLSTDCLPVLPEKAKAIQDIDSKIIDKRIVLIKAGSGGNGCCSFASSPLKPFAGPDGGNGGNGGHIIFEARRSTSSLNEIKSTYKAPSGGHGGSSCRTGKSGRHLIIEVPVKTKIRVPPHGPVVASLDNHGDIYIGAHGGAGGRGNYEFLSNLNRAPEEHELGARGENKYVELEMTMLADFGIIGMPNAGKSSLLRAVSRARPKVADYPFTTLFPQIGVVEFDDHFTLSIAEVPGLISGSSMNRGLGTRFLHHIYACKSIVVLLDLTVEDPRQQFNILFEEMTRYDEDMISRKPIIIAGNKVDQNYANWEVLYNELKKKYPKILCLPISVKENINLIKLLRLMRKIVVETKRLEKEAEDIYYAK